MIIYTICLVFGLIFTVISALAGHLFGGHDGCDLLATFLRSHQKCVVPSQLSNVFSQDDVGFLEPDGVGLD